MSMGNVSRKLKRWKWPLGAAGAILVIIGLNTVKASPEFAAAQSASDTNNTRQHPTDMTQSQDGADQWMDRRGRQGQGMRGQQGGHFGGSRSDRGSIDSGGGSSGDVGSESGGGFRSSTRTS